MNKIDELQGIVNEDPDDFEARFMLGKAMFDAELLDAAAMQLETATRLNPELPAAFRWLGNCYEKLGRIPDAVATYQLGIAVAEATGWLQPAKEMRVFLKRLGASEKVDQDRAPETDGLRDA